MSKFFVNFAERGQYKQKIDITEVETLDKETPTSINEFFKIFASDHSFAPPESQMIFDSDISEIDIDNDVAPSMAYDFEEAAEDDEKARARE